jgi:MFS family permease
LPGSAGHAAIGELHARPFRIPVDATPPGYLALFGPLVLIPQMLGAGGPGGVLRAGLVLSALPVGFGLAALGAEAVLPPSWGNRQRGAAGGLGCAAAMVALIFVPVSPVGLAWTLFLAGLGLGVFIPASNTAIMSVSAGASAGVLGGLVNLARGIGTALGVGIVTLALHLAGSATRPGAPDPRLALAMLAVAATAAALTALAGRRVESRPVKDRRAAGNGPGGRAQKGEGPDALG